ncbi:replication initiator protein [Shigella flexneri]|nr:replication initiator protein [Shigella flexneri]
MGSCAAPSAKGDDKFITTDYLQQCHFLCLTERRSTATQLHRYRGQPATAGASRT